MSEHRFTCRKCGKESGFGGQNKLMFCDSQETDETMQTRFYNCEYCKEENAVSLKRGLWRSIDQAQKLKAKEK